MGQFSNTETSLLDNHIDDHVDVEIQECLSSDPPKSFFMFAGAGSGKTRSLINTLEYLDKEKGHYLAERGKQIAVITYTNAACDEIGRRLQYKPIFMVSTIHSFLWEMIKSFQQDIKIWVECSIAAEIDELQIKQKTGKGGSAATARAEKIISKQKRLVNSYPEFAIACAGYAGMAVAQWWDQDWGRHHNAKYETLHGPRGFDDMDEYIVQNILGLPLESVDAKQIMNILLCCAQKATTFIQHEHIEHQTVKAFHIFARTVKVMFRVGAALQLKRLGYKFHKVDVSKAGRMLS